MQKAKKKSYCEEQTNRYPDYFSFFLLKKKKPMNNQNLKQKRHEARTDGVVKNDHKTSFYNW